MGIELARPEKGRDFSFSLPQPLDVHHGAKPFHKTSGQKNWTGGSGAGTWKNVPYMHSDRTMRKDAVRQILCHFYIGHKWEICDCKFYVLIS